MTDQTPTTDNPQARPEIHIHVAQPLGTPDEVAALLTRIRESDRRLRQAAQDAEPEPTRYRDRDGDEWVRGDDDRWSAVGGGESLSGYTWAELLAAYPPLTPLPADPQSTPAPVRTW